MPKVSITRADFLENRQGRTFADVVNDPKQPFDTVLEFFNSEDQQRRMVESEVRFHRAPLAAVEPELESQPSIQDFLSSHDPHRRRRLGQAITVVVRMIMDRLGWKVVPQAVRKGCGKATKRSPKKAGVSVTRDDFLQDRQGRTFADVVNDPEQPFDAVLEFFNREDRQRRMVESEVRYNSAPLAAVERELKSQPSIQDFLSSKDPHRRKRLRQAITVVVRMIMDRLGWGVVPQAVRKG